MSAPLAVIEALDRYATEKERSEDEDYIDTGDLWELTDLLASQLTFYTGYIGQSKRGD